MKFFLPKVGIVGCGLIGNKRAKVIKDDPTCCLLAVSDVVVSNAESMVQRYGDGIGRIPGITQDRKGSTDNQNR